MMKKSYMKYRQHGNNVIGVAKGTVFSRLKEISSKNRIGIAEQAYSLLLLYRIDLDNKQEKWLEKISNYKKTVFSQMMLAFSTRTHYMNMNMGIKVRLSILLGNR